MATSRRGRTTSRTTPNRRAKAAEEAPAVESTDMAAPEVVESEPKPPEVSEPVEAVKEESDRPAEPMPVTEEQPVEPEAVSEVTPEEPTEEAIATVAESPVEAPTEEVIATVADSPVEAPQAITKEEPMSNAEVIEATATPAEGEAKNGAIQIHQTLSLSIWDRPVMPSDIEVVGEIHSAGTRPIEASHLAIFGTILNGRPIMCSDLKVAEMLPGGRPIFFSDFHGVEGAEFSGGRPIMMSEPGLMAASTLPGGRPIFSNQDDNPLTLMGYID